MKKILVLVAILTSIPAYADNLNYRIIQDGSTMMIIPSHSENSIQKPIYNINSTPAKIPYYSFEKTLPKAKNRTRSV